MPGSTTPDARRVRARPPLPGTGAAIPRPPESSPPFPRHRPCRASCGCAFESSLVAGRARVTMASMRMIHLVPGRFEHAALRCVLRPRATAIGRRRRVSAPQQIVPRLGVVGAVVSTARRPGHRRFAQAPPQPTRAWTPDRFICFVQGEAIALRTCLPCDHLHRYIGVAQREGAREVSGQGTGARVRLACAGAAQGHRRRDPLIVPPLCPPPLHRPPHDPGFIIYDLYITWTHSGARPRA